MTSKEILAFSPRWGSSPIVRTSSAEGAIQAVEPSTRAACGPPRSPWDRAGALHALEKLADRFAANSSWGPATVLDPETARACMLAGAEFFVTPSLRLSTIEMAKRYSKVICPGALTPTEVLTAWEAGADAVKIFPAAT